MKKILLEDNKFILQDGAEQEILLDNFDLMSNKSRLPMHTLSDGDTIPGLILSLVEKHTEISSGTGEDTGNGPFAAYLMDILLASFLIRTPAPLKVVEIGSVNGVQSYHLATLMGRLNPESSLCCVSNVIGNESESQWLNRIVMVEQPPALSMLAADYEDTQLASNHFDIVFINGTVRIDKPYETIREAERLVKKGGFLMCHAKEVPLLESSFKLIFSERKEYEITSEENILITRYEGDSWKSNDNTCLKTEVAELVRMLHQTVTSAGGCENLRPLVHRIDTCADKAGICHDIRRKTALLRLKELTLDYMLNIGDEFEKLYKERLELMTADMAGR